ncbi:MAG TPA: transporter [Sphingobium sp.]|uniref:transporter n=1 Tax=Sphingobium sp. TaxID=1912891 RepID=UPI002ED01C9B
MTRLALTRWLSPCVIALMPGVAYAADTPDQAGDFAQQLANLAARVSAQQSQIDAQQRQIAADRAEITRLKEQGVAVLADERAMGVGSGTTAPSQPSSATASAESQPIVPAVAGEPPKPDIAEKARAVPQGLGVLTPAGQTTIQPSITYIRAANNRLVFAGIELVPGLQIGSIQASTADRNTTIAQLSVWHGFSSRLEGELTIPMMRRQDSIHLSQVRDGTVTEGFDLSQTALGDIEGAIRWQLNAPTSSDKPIFVAALRVKSDTGISPFSISYDEFGIARGLATGSGFWGVQPGITFLLPSDPAVIYGGLSYLYQFSRNINRVVNDTLIGEVKPGGAINANIGFGFALNPRFSFSLGYSHSYIRPTKTELSGSIQESSTLQVGTLDFGMSYRLTQHNSVNFAFQFGVTQDAPGVAITLRVPFTF